MPTIESPIGRRTRRDRSRRAAGLARAALLVVIVLLNLSALMVSFLSGAPAAHAASPSLHIKVPNPSGGIASGPVGANVSVSGTGDANHKYNFGYAAALSPAPTLDACSQGVKDLQSSVTAQKDGTFSASFVWPSSAGTRGSSYYICAQDQAIVGPSLGGAIQSSEVFKVLASEAPNISLDVAPSSNATPVPTPTDGGYYAGSRIQITGTNFWPGGVTLRAFVTASQTFSASDAQAYRPLAQDNNNTAFRSDNNGSFVIDVTLPQSPQGVVYLHVVSTDYTSTFPPALDANQQITLAKAQLTPTPSSPTPNTTVTASPPTTPGHDGGGQPQTPDPANVLAVIGLSGLSVILFVVGIILMTSASTMPRAPR